MTVSVEQSADTSARDSSGYLARVADDLLGASRLAEELEAAGAKPLLRYETSYSRREVDEAPLCMIFIEGAQKGEGGPSHGSRFDLSDACPACGTGAKLVGDFLFRSSDLPKRRRVFETLDRDLLVADELREELEAAGSTGLAFHDVRPPRGGEREPWSLLLAPRVLPPMSDLTDGIMREDQCPTCERDGFFEDIDEPLAVRYDLTAEEIAALPDFVSTWECFGNSHIANPFEESHFARPRLLAKPPAGRLLATDKRVKLVPISLTTTEAHQ